MGIIYVIEQGNIQQRVGDFGIGEYCFTDGKLILL
jgi:hypothetical protein